VLLNGSGLVVAAKLQVHPGDLAQCNRSEVTDGWGRVVARDFHRDVLILVKVDARVGGVKKLTALVSGGRLGGEKEHAATPALTLSHTCSNS
jgi:hypothetical protein